MAGGAENRDIDAPFIVKHRKRKTGCQRPVYGEPGRADTGCKYRKVCWREEFDVIRGLAKPMLAVDEARWGLAW